jgi:hypothetical protein
MRTAVEQVALCNISAAKLANALVACVLSLTGAAHAGFIGTQMDVGYYTPDTVSPYASAVFTAPSFTVGVGQETIGDIEGVTNLFIDVTDNMLSVTFGTILSNPTWNANNFNGVIFTATSPLNIRSMLVDASTTMAGFDNSRLSYKDHQILLNWQGLSYVDGTKVNINFTSASAVPEPGTLALLGLGFACLVWRGRKQ